jgi:hypothetical protein
MRRPTAQQFKADTHRRIRFATQGLGRALVHTHDFAGMGNTQARTIDTGVASNQGFKKGGLAD